MFFILTEMHILKMKFWQLMLVLPALAVAACHEQASAPLQQQNGSNPTTASQNTTVVAQPRNNDDGLLGQWYFSDAISATQGNLTLNQDGKFIIEIQGDSPDSASSQTGTWLQTAVGVTLNFDTGRQTAALRKIFYQQDVRLGEPPDYETSLAEGKWGFSRFEKTPCTGKDYSLVN